MMHLTPRHIASRRGWCGRHRVRLAWRVVCCWKAQRCRFARISIVKPPPSRRRPEKGGVRPGAGAFPRRTDYQAHMLADTLCRPLRFILTPGQTGDITQAPALLQGQEGEACSLTKHMTAIPYAPSLPVWAPRPSSPQTAVARSSSPMTGSSTNSAIASNDASAALSISDVSRHAMSVAPSSSQVSSISPPS